MIGADRPDPALFILTALLTTVIKSALHAHVLVSCQLIQQQIEDRLLICSTVFRRVDTVHDGRHVLSTAETDGDVAAVGLSSARWHRPGHAALRRTRTYHQFTSHGSPIIKAQDIYRSGRRINTAIHTAIG